MNRLLFQKVSNEFATYGNSELSLGNREFLKAEQGKWHPKIARGKIAPLSAANFRDCETTKRVSPAIAFLHSLPQ